MTNKPVCVCVDIMLCLSIQASNGMGYGDGDGWAHFTNIVTNIHSLNSIYIDMFKWKAWNMRCTLIIALFICCEKWFKWNFIHTKETKSRTSCECLTRAVGAEKSTKLKANIKLQFHRGNSFLVTYAGYITMKIYWYFLKFEPSYQ